MNLFRSKKKFFAAVETGSLETVRDYVTADKKWAKSVTKNDNTAAHIAAEKGYGEMLDYLFENGAKHTDSNDFGEYPLHKAIAGHHVEIVKKLLEGKSIDYINATFRSAASPLHLAISENQQEILEMFLKTGKADLVNGTPPALFYAVESRKPDMVKALLAAGADPNVAKITNPYGYGYDDDLFYDDFDSYSPRRGDKTQRDTPLNRACALNEAGIALLLLEAGGKTMKHEFPLHAAARNGNIELATALIRHGTDIQAQDKSGQTVLHAAAIKGNVEMASFLLAQGSKKEIPDEKKRTALSYAQQYALKEMVDLLQEPVKLAPVQIKQVEKPAPAAAVKKPVAPTTQREKTSQDSETWNLAGKNGIAHTSVFPSLDRKLTEIFNFESRERLVITENLSLGTETMTPQESFDSISEDALMRALKEFRRLGGQAKEEDVLKNHLNKSKLKPGNS